jgi:hypothetical protein
MELRVPVWMRLEVAVGEVVVVVELRPLQRMQMVPILKFLSYLVDVRATSLVRC